MPKVRRKAKKAKKSSKTRPMIPAESVDQYVHDYEKRPNNPPVGLVTPETDREMPKRHYEYDPHLDPQLQWTGKKENTSFEVDTISLHVHERIDPLTIIEKARKKQEFVQETLLHYFEQPENNPPLREAIDFYKHSQNWSNRLIAGDSLLVMNSLLQKEGMAGKVQMIYMDPPYGIKYGSNFQPFLKKRDVKDGKDEDLTQEPEMIRAFRDTWGLGVHSYLSYLRDRLLLAKELLTDSGSIFIQISDENLHHVRELLDEVFGSVNFISIVSFVTTSGFEAKTLPRMGDYIIWYAKDKNNVKYRQLYTPLDTKTLGAANYRWIMLSDGKYRGMTAEELRGEIDLPQGAKIYKPTNLVSQGSTKSPQTFEFGGKKYLPSANQHWKTSVEGLRRLAENNRIHVAKNSIQYIRYPEDFPFKRVTNIWLDTATGNFTEDKIYVVQTSSKVVQRCILMTTDPGDLVFDPTCGSGTSAYAAEKWGRRWITCDTSRVAISLTKQRLMTSFFDYYELRHPDEGVNAGFNYKNAAHITLKSIATGETSEIEYLFDQPNIEKNKTRVCGPFTVEAVPAPVVRAIGNLANSQTDIDSSISRAGETTRQDHWRSEILATGVLGRGAEKITFSRVEAMQGTEWLHADAETREREPRRVVISFGSDYAPLEQKQVARAIEEAQTLVPRPKMILFVAFQFDPEAAKDIDELKWGGVTVLRVQMNTDLLTEDLKKKVSKSQSFWLMGQPDVEINKSKDGKYVVEVEGFDYYNTQTHEIESGDSSRIAMWMLDTDYDGRSLYPQQVFFPMAGDADGWSRIGKSIKAQIDEDLLEKYHGTVSLPFELGSNKRVAVKIIDDRGIESLKILKVK